ncbi:OmpA family protein [Hydrocarboniphaga sp.]|uniref:OmpA family protein n=1 Tax=Hydrocarboniphaga sp. TaxID=2033016 RepID=UPI003D12274C
MKAFRLALIPLVIASTYSPAYALDDNRIYVAPMFSYALADDDRDADDGMGGTLAAGVMLTEQVAFELRGTYLNYGEPDSNTGSKKENWMGGAGINAYLTPYGSGPYLHADIQAGDGTNFNAGLGWDLAFSPGGWGIRAEALYHVQKTDDNRERDFNEPLFNLGLRIPFGAPPVAPPPPPEPVVVVPPPPPPPPQCSDGIDNDGDGQIDFPADKGCTDANDNDEYNPICKAPEPGQPMTLEGCGVGDTIVLQGVTFEFDKARLTPNAKVILDGVGTALDSRPDIKVEIGGHTDSKGSDAYNLKLSDRRAASVKTYLESKGVAAARMSSHGYGEAVPVADNATDEGRELNRRVELKVTESAGGVTVAPTVRTAENAAPLPAEAAPAAPSAAVQTVTIKDFAYTPNTLTVPVGTTVTWTNDDGSNHFVAFPDQKSDRLKMGATYTRTFSSPGVYEYACTLHPEMKGKVVVQ